MKRAVIVREKITRLVPMLTEKSVNVTQRGTRAYVSYAPSGRPQVVNIPYIADDSEDQFLDAIEGFLDHEVGHVLFTDYKVLMKAKSLGIKNLHNIVEDTYVERMMASFFSGSGMNLTNVATFFLKTYTDKKLVEDPKNKVAYLMVPAIRALAGQAVYRDYMESKWKEIADIEKKIRAYGEANLPKIESSVDALRVAIELEKLIEGEKPKAEKPPVSPPPPPSDEGSDGSDPDDGEDLEDPDDSEEPESDDEASGEDPDDSEESESEDLGDSGEPAEEGEEGEESDEEFHTLEESEEGESGEDDAGTPGEEELADGTEEASETSGSDDVSSAGDGSKGKSSWKDIEDKIKDFDDAISEELTKASVASLSKADYRVYSRDFDKIEEFDTSGFTQPMLDGMQDAVDHLVGPMQKDLERAVAARSASTLSAGHRSGRLHAAALSKLTMFGDERVFRRKHENHTKDVSVSLLIDCSGSMSGTKIDAAAKAAYGLASVLDRLKIKNEVLGFTTSGRLPAEAFVEERKTGVRYSRHLKLYIPILKGFEEGMTPEVKRRFAYLAHSHILSENVDGESVQIAASRLAVRREKRKILIVLSDGQPACPGDYHSLGPHLRSVIEDTEKMGVEVLGIGIMTTAPAAYYPKHVLLNSISELPTEVIGQIKRLLLK